MAVATNKVRPLVGRKMGENGEIPSCAAIAATTEVVSGLKMKISVRGRCVGIDFVGGNSSVPKKCSKLKKSWLLVLLNLVLIQKMGRFYGYHKSQKVNADGSFFVKIGLAGWAFSA